MKCPRCGLQNLDNVKVCIKCNYQLIGISLPEDFSAVPPRAGYSQRFKRVYWKWRRSRRVVLPEGNDGDKVPFWQSSIFKLFYCEEPLSGSLLAVALSFLLPGCGQFILGRRLRGIIFIIPSLLALLIFMLAIASYFIDLINIAASIYLIFQCISVFDAMPRIRAYRVTDWLVNLIVAALLWLGCFVSVNIAVVSAAHYLWSGVELRDIMFNYPENCVIRRNDTIVIQKQETYPRGSLVAYSCQMPYLYDNSLRWEEYNGIDKIIGLPGETVIIKDGTVSVDSGELADQQDLTLLKCKIPDMQWTLGENEYFVFPSVANIRARLLKIVTEERRITVVKKANITGRIIRITAPFARRKTL